MDLGLCKWYQSEAIGNRVRTRREVLYQMIESLIKYRTPDFRWHVIWLSR